MILRETDRDFGPFPPQLMVPQVLVPTPTSSQLKDADDSQKKEEDRKVVKQERHPSPKTDICPRMSQIIFIHTPQM